MTRGLDRFIGLYPVRKTLRFELRPVGETQRWIDERGIVEADRALSEDYAALKDIVDGCHRRLINAALDDACSEIDYDWSPLAAAVEAFRDAAPADRYSLRPALEREQQRCRKAMVDRLRNPGKHGVEGTPGFESLFKAELFKTVLPAWCAGDGEAEQVVARFGRFTSYLSGYNIIRRHLYSDEDKAGAVAHRIVNQNFPRFLENASLFAALKADAPEALEEARASLEGVLGEFDMDSMFELGFFNGVLSQRGIDFYNAVLGGVSTPDGHAKGVNQCVHEAHQAGRLARRVKLSPLYKQMLSERESLSFTLDKIEDDREAASLLVDLTAALHLSDSDASESPIDAFGALVRRLPEFEWEGVFVAAKHLEELSKLVAGDWAALGRVLDDCAEKRCGPALGMTKAKAGKWRKQGAFSLAEIAGACEAAGEKVDIPADVAASFERAAARVEASKADALGACEGRAAGGRDMLSDEAAAGKVKTYLDALLACLHAIRMFEAPEDLRRDASFYSVLDEAAEAMRPVPSALDKLRNYLTQKPYSERKFKLNFGCSTLAAGWDVSKERENRCVLLRRDGLYYLGVVDAGSKKALDKAPAPEGGEPVFERMRNKNIPGPNKMLPKVFFAEGNRDKYRPDDEVMRIREEGTYKQGEGFSIADMRTLVDFFKRSIAENEAWSMFAFDFSPTESYRSIADFYDEVAAQGYKIWFEDVPATYVDALVESGDLYLFRIHSKDFSARSKGRKNLHTLYFEQLFSEENLADVVFKLDGGAELFYRPASVKDPVVHRAGSMLVNRTYADAEGNEVRIPEDVYQEVYGHANGRIAKADLSFEARMLVDSGLAGVHAAPFDVVKDRRYTEPKYQFHLPVTVNFKAMANVNVNQVALEHIDGNADVRVLAVSRGEQNLVYMTLVDRTGRIVFQRSLNSIGGVDYRERIAQRERERDSARRNWKAINRIKQLKEGYLSLVVHEVARAMVENDAILVLEDLGEDRKRARIDKQVYQRFEKQLVDKLNYFAMKPGEGGVDVDAPGGVLRGYQLAGKFESFQKMGRQSGMMFYAPSWGISRVDPATSFAPSVRARYESVEKSREFFGAFERICYDAEEGCFAFTFDPRRLNERAHDSRKTWTVFTRGRRVEVVRDARTGRWKSAEVELTHEMAELLAAHGIAYGAGDLREAICGRADKALFAGLMRLFSLTLQMRNRSAHAGGSDYLVSPVRGADGGFFDSRAARDGQPDCADAAEAYLLALRGVWMLERGVRLDEASGKRYTVSPTGDEWFAWLQERPPRR